MRVLAKYWGCYPYQYYRYDFYRRDCQVTVSEMKDYIPNFFMYSLFFPRSFMDYVRGWLSMIRGERPEAFSKRLTCAGSAWNRAPVAAPLNSRFIS